MTVEEVRAYLLEKQVPDHFYSLEGGSTWETIVIDCSRAGSWYVYYQERSSRELEREFTSESEACAYFLELMRRGYGFLIPGL